MEDTSNLPMTNDYSSDPPDISYLRRLADILEQKGATEHSQELRRIADKFRTFSVLEKFALTLLPLLPTLLSTLNHASTNQKSNESQTE